MDKDSLLKFFLNPGDICEHWKQARKRGEDTRQMLRMISQAFGLPIIDLEDSLIEAPALLRKIPEHIAAAYIVLPVGYTKDAVIIAIATPFMGTFPLELKRMLGEQVVFRLAEPDLLADFIEKNYAELNTASNLPEDEDIDRLDHIENLEDLAKAAPVVRLVNKIFSKSIHSKASDIHISPYEDGLHVRHRIDGVLYETDMIPRKLQAAIISRIKIMADLDIAEHRVPQDGRIKLKIEGKKFDVRVATTPTVFGEGTVMRILDKSDIRIDIKKMGFSASMLNQWLTILSRPSRVVLVTGPTGSGKTTTLYASLNHVKSSELKLISVEDPVEYQLSGIDQIQVNKKVNMTFAAALRSILRQDPDIIMIGEIRDEETAEIAIQSALTGHLVLATLHTNDAPSAVTRLIEIGIESYLVSSSVAGILAQRLARRLCTCKRKTENETWQPVGCDRCGDTGYKGRIGIFELLIFDDNIRKMISKRVDSSIIREYAEKNGMLSLFQDGMDKVKQGVTTESEIKRIIME
jgi:type II secretory ATPase GspE/PulE/Tfp pilus assembly ATPase PilB-like protein